MFARNTMKCPNNRAFEQRPNAFGRVCVNVSANPFLNRVINRKLSAEASRVKDVIMLGEPLAAKSLIVNFCKGY